MILIFDFEDIFIILIDCISAGAGVDNIDIAAATKHNVIVLK